MNISLSDVVSLGGDMSRYILNINEAIIPIDSPVIVPMNSHDKATRTMMSSDADMILLCVNL